MTMFGYARVSTTDQDTDLQLAELKAAGCETIRTEKKSATTRQGRTELATTLDFIRAGDVLVVTRLDRLARSVADLANIVAELEAKGAKLRILNAALDTSTASGKAFLGMLGVFAEFETNLRRERQMDGIVKAKKAGVYKGRKPQIDADQVRALRADGVGPAEIARRLGIGRASVYRVLKAA